MDTTKNETVKNGEKAFFSAWSDLFMYMDQFRYYKVDKYVSQLGLDNRKAEQSKNPDYTPVTMHNIIDVISPAEAEAFSEEMVKTVIEFLNKKKAEVITSKKAGTFVAKEHYGPYKP